MIPDAHRKLLEEKAKELGAHNVLLIPAERIVVENRTILKCIFGCDGWGSQVCPPFIPTVDEFRAMLKEYCWALLVDWKSENKLPKEISENFVKYGVSPPEDLGTREAYQRALRTVIKERKERIQPGSLELEKLAWKLGYNTALATFPGMCTWYASEDYAAVDCARGKTDCHHPTMRRPCLMGLGIRLDKTLEKLGIPLPNFPIENVIPKQYTLLLIE
jgi:predicted metal-binding protein